VCLLRGTDWIFIIQVILVFNVLNVFSIFATVSFPFNPPSKFNEDKFRDKQSVGRGRVYWMH
jgi:hypothetical protein